MDNKFNPYQEAPFDGPTSNMDPYQYSQQMHYQQQMQLQQIPSNNLNNLSENNMNYMMSHNGKQNEQPSSNMGLHQPQLHQPYERSVERPHSNEHHIPMPNYNIPTVQQQQQQIPGVPGIPVMYQHPPQAHPMPSGGGHLMPAAPLDYHMQVPNNEMNVLAQKPEMSYQTPQHQFQPLAMPPVENLHAAQQIPHYEKPYDGQLGPEQQIHYMAPQIQPELLPQQPTPMQIQIANKWNLPPTCPKKKRRRIVQENEEDSDDNELHRATLNKSPPPVIAEIKNKDEEEAKAENSGEDVSELKDPQAIKEHQARNLLKGAVMIQAASDKKKKIRVLDSDDEQEQTNVDDIGMESNDINFDEQGDENVELVVPIDNPIIPQDEDPEVLPTAETKDPENIKKENAENKSSKEDLESADPDKEKQLSEDELDDGLVPAMKVEAVLEKDEEDKGEDDSELPNDLYFGTPDKNVPVAQVPKKRGRKPGTVMNTTRKKVNKYEKETYSESSESSSDATFSEDSYSSSSGASSDEMSHGQKKRQVYKSSVQVRPKFTYANVPQLMRKVAPPVISSRPSKPQPKKKDRFYDKSRDIPNDVYFGDVKVPLHVLHTRWASDVSPESSSDSSSESDHYTYAKGKTGAPRGRPPNSARKNIPQVQYEVNDDPRLSQMKNFLKVAGIKANYPRLFEGIQSVEDKCTILRRILAQKGMQGEVTVAKCRQLKLDIQVKRENQELDTSAIIETEGGRTRRSVGTRSSKKVSNQNIEIQPETLQTLSKMKRIVDSDSE